MESSSTGSSSSIVGDGITSKFEDPSSLLEALTSSVEKVDSLYHLASFIITHPFYLENAGKILHLQLPSWLRQKSANLQVVVKPHDVIGRVSAIILHLMVALLFLQIVGLYSFISAQATPQCEEDAECPLTSFCATGDLTYIMTGYETSCLSCFGIMDWTGSRYPVDAVHHLNGNLTDPNDLQSIPNCQVGHYRNDRGDSILSVVAMVLVAFTIGAYLAKVGAPGGANAPEDIKGDDCFICELC